MQFMREYFNIIYAATVLLLWSDNLSLYVVLRHRWQVCVPRGHESVMCVIVHISRESPQLHGLFQVLPRAGEDGRSQL